MPATSSSACSENHRRKLRSFDVWPPTTARDTAGGFDRSAERHHGRSHQESVRKGGAGRPVTSRNVAVGSFSQAYRTATG